MNESRDSARGINGEDAALGVDRAVGELRRGRAVHIAGRAPGGRRIGLVAAAVEAASTTLLTRLEAAAGPLRLLLTGERARAVHIASDAHGPVAVAPPPGCPAEELRTLAGAGVIEPGSNPFLTVDPQPACAELAAAGFMLTKAGRLLPALVAAETPAPPDESVLSVDVETIHAHARFARHSVKRISQSRVPLADALDCELALFRDEHSLGEHVAVIIGSPDRHGVVPVRLHSACLTGDLLGSLRCDCGEQLRTAVQRIAGLGGGVLLYLDQEGRGIGLANKLRAYALQDSGLDTIDADRRLGFLDDERTYDVAVALLRQLGIARIELLTNNPRKIEALRAHGIEVAGRVPLIAAANLHNARYLRTKRERAGHLVGDSES